MSSGVGFALPASLSKCFASDEFRKLEIISVKLHCNFFANWNRYSIGIVIPTAHQPTIEKIMIEFEKIFARDDIPRNYSESHWDLFVEIPNHEFVWFRKEGKEPDSCSYRCDQAKPYPAGHFLEYYKNLATVLSSLFYGREIISVLDDRGEFVKGNDMQIQSVNKPIIKPVIFES